MGEIAEWLIEQEMFGYKEDYNGNVRSKRTPAEKKIASIRKEIAINVKDGISLDEARRNANIKYGKGWRERGLISNSDNQWSEEDLKKFH